MRTDPFAAALRAAAAECLPPGAFLRRDRGEALFVTDAPRLRPGIDWPRLVSRAGFIGAEADGLLRLSPGPAWLARLEAAYPVPPDDLCAGLQRFSGLAPDAEALRLFAMGARTLDGGGDAARYDRALRQRAAVCLRLNRTRPEGPTTGGGLYACALLNHLIEKERWT